MRPGLPAKGLVFVLFFFICLGLGYAGVKRYHPQATPGLQDSAHYLAMVKHGPGAAGGHWRYRVLTTYLAKPFYLLARGRVGSWDPAAFGLLVANSLFCAGAALLIALLGMRWLGDTAPSLLASCLYLLNFAVPQLQLAGLVDASEAFLLLLTAWLLAERRMAALPIMGVALGLAKETGVVFAAVLAGAWLLADGDLRRSAGGWLALAAMATVGLATVSAVHSALLGHLIWPWQVAAGEGGLSGFGAAFWSQISQPNFWYVLGWLLPLGLWRLGRLPRPWRFGSLCAAGVALLLGAWNDAGGNVARAVFNTAGPLLCLSSAALICDLWRPFAPTSDGHS